MTLEEVQKAFPIGARVKLSSRLGDRAGVVFEHRVYEWQGDIRNGQGYVGYKEDEAYHDYAWPEDLTVVKPLSPLEISIKTYIDEEMRLLSC